MHVGRPTARYAFLAAAAIAATSLASAQCSPHWVSAVGAPGIGGNLPTAMFVNCMVTWDPDGSGPLPPLLVVAGRFNSAGGIAANNIATWNPATGAWAPLGSGMNGFAIHSLAVLPNGQLVAGGQFTTAGGTPANNIARWNGTTWAALGTGASDTVGTLAVLPNGDLVAGGSFLSAGGTTVNFIAKWNGSSWAPLGTGFDTAVDGLLALPNGDLIAGGDFNATAGGLPLRHVARWSAGAWTALGDGVGTQYDYVLTLAILPNGNLVAGGNFATPTNGMAQWNGASWSPVGTGLSTAAVESLITLPSGDLIAAGHFSTAGPVTANNIARWNGSAWTALGTGISGSGYPILYNVTTLPNGDIMAGGIFTSAGGLPANNIARYSFGVSADFNHDGDTGTDQDIDAFFACLAGNCCPACGSADFNADGDIGTDQDIESFFRVLSGGPC